MADSYLQKQIQQARSPFEGVTGFREVRKHWDLLLNMRYPTKLQDELEKWAAAADYRTPDLRREVRDWETVIANRPTVYSAPTTDKSLETQKLVRQALMFAGRGWEYENEGRIADHKLTEGMVRWGMAVMQYCWYAQYEPKVDAALEADEYLKKRTAALKKRKYPFHLQFPSIYSCCWLGDEKAEEGPSFFVTESVIPYIEAKETYRKDGKHLGFDRLKKTAWFGEDDALMEDTSIDPSIATIRITTVDALDHKAGPCPIEGCEHKMRKICIYVCDGDADATEEDLYEEKVSPFDHCSYLVVAALPQSERDPHLRFIPVLDAAYSDAQVTNYLTTLLHAMMRRDYSPSGSYLDYAMADKELLTGGDGQIKTDYDFSAIDEGKLPAYPGLIRKMPSDISAHLPLEIQNHRERLDRNRINRFLVGDTSTEASNATLGAYTSAEQQAGLLPGDLAGNIDEAQLITRRMAFHAIRFWHAYDPSGVKVPYTVPMTGNNSVVKYKNITVVDGESATVDGEMLNELDFDLVIKSRTDTLNEALARWTMGKDKKKEGAYTTEQMLESAGIDDIVGQLKLLDLENIRRNFSPIQVQLDNSEVLKMFEAGTGISTGLGGMGPAEQQPPLSNGASPNGPEQSFLRRAEGPSGGTSPIARTMP